MANIIGGVQVTGFISPTDSSDTYAVIDPIYGVDGLRSVSGTTERNNITTERRREGMLVYVQSDGKYYKLLPSPWSGTNSDWVEFSVNSSGGTDTYWTSGSTGNFSIKAINDSGLEATGDYAVAMGNATTAYTQSSFAMGVNAIASGSSITTSASPITITSAITITLLDPNYSLPAVILNGLVAAEWLGYYNNFCSPFTIYSGSSSQTIDCNSYTDIYEDSGLTYIVDSTIVSTEYDMISGDTFEYVTIFALEPAFAIGNNVRAYGASSFAEGSGTIASGDYSHAEGQQTTAGGDYSHAEGYYTTAGGDYSHAEGYYTTASGVNCHAEGAGTIASDYDSHAEGYQTTASGLRSHAEGSGTIANNTASHAEGSNTIASGQYSHAEGQSTIASGTASHAEGNGTKALGLYSHAEGYVTTASGDYSHAEGIVTTASGDGSHAGGYESIASGQTSFVHGQYSVALQDATIVLGNNITGTSANTTYVDKLNIKSFPLTSAVNTLAIDSNGNVVSGSYDMNVTGGTYNPSNGVGTFTNNSGGTFTVSGFLTGYTDIYTTGTSYNYTSNTLTISGTNQNYTASGFTKPAGPTNSVQYMNTNGLLSGSSAFTFSTTSNSNSVTISSPTLTTNPFGTTVSLSLNDNTGSVSGSSLFSLNSGIGSNFISSYILSAPRNYSYNPNYANSILFGANNTGGGIGPVNFVNFLSTTATTSTFRWGVNTAFQYSSANDVMVLSGGSSGNLWVKGNNSIATLTLRTTPTTNSGSTQVLVRNTTTGVVEQKATSDFIQNNGSAKFSYVAKIANYTATTSDYTIDCVSNSFTITLPTAVGNTGLVLVLKNSGSGTTITPATLSAQTIDGNTPSPTYDLTNKTPLRVQSNGSNWIII